MGATYPLGGTRHHHGTPWFVAEPAAGPKPNPLAPIPPTPVRQTARSRTPDVSRPDPEVSGCYAATSRPKGVMQKPYKQS